MRHAVVSSSFHLVIAVPGQPIVSPATALCSLLLFADQPPHMLATTLHGTAGPWPMRTASYDATDHSYDAYPLARLWPGALGPLK